MGKIKLIIFIFIFIIIFCFVGVFFVQADTEIEGEEDILEVQNNITNSINVYGYTFDNPNVIINPYGENYNSALIIFETDEYVSLKVNVNNIDTFNSRETNKHYIGVYNLLTGSNYINLSYGKNSKKIEIVIEEENNPSILENGILLSNNHLLIPTDKYIDNDIYTGIREVDALGKIYYEYLINDGYKNIACEIDDERLAVLGDNLIILDRQNGDILSSFDISDYSYDWIGMDYVDEKIVLYSSEKNISINIEGDISDTLGSYNKKYLKGDINYKNIEAIRFFKEKETKKSNESIWLLNYSDEMKNEIDIQKEFNRIIISSEDINGCNTYLVLEKLLDKRVYQLCDKINYIYTYDFDGKYSVYFKIDNEVYKTDKYLEF